MMESAESPRRSSSSSSSSPEFEFWMVRNRSGPTQDLHSADELFLHGVILPLDLISIPRSGPSGEETPPENTPSPPHHPPAEPPPSTILSTSLSVPTSGSRRWKDLFKAVGDKKQDEKDKEKHKQRERKKERSKGSGGTSAELNITLNIWPFSRSRSAGTTSGNLGRPRPADSIAGRRVSSAPCSRSNSRGENTKPPATTSAGGFVRSRRWAASPGRSGVHVGRASPVCQLRRTWGVETSEKTRKPSPDAATATGSGGARLLNLKVNGCIGYRNQVSCRGDDSDGITGGDCTVNRNPRNGSFFGLRARFSKKVY